MSRQTAIKLQVEVGPDHMIRLPEDVPVGPAEVIVLVAETAPALPAARKSLLGLFADEPEVVDEAMTHVRERRTSWRMRPAT
ncbi:MAG TPA: hypothetical protein VM925_30435 [Labilithrix sp.]|nr:hypothetical protein [Labilithrix sp.]